MKFFTSYYAKMPEIKEKYPDYVIVSISGGLEEFIKPFIDIWDRRLAPKKDFFNAYKNSPEGQLREDEYVKQFKNKVLIREDNISMNDILKTWSENSGLGKTYILMCYEKPQDFCHRHIVAEAIEQKYGIEVPELFYEDYERIKYKMKPKGNIDEEEW